MSLRKYIRNIIQENIDDLIEYIVPSWTLGALINGDYSGLTEEEEASLERFTDMVVSRHGNAFFMQAGNGGEDDGSIGGSMGFRYSNDVDNLGSDCYKVLIRPSKEKELNEDNEEGNSNVAQIILQQIKSMDRNALAAWGAKNFVAGGRGELSLGLGPKMEKSIDYKTLGYIQMDVSGSAFKGRMYISLSPRDEYDLIFITKKRGEHMSYYDLHKEIEGVYVDNLIDVIDGVVK